MMDIVPTPGILKWHDVDAWITSDATTIYIDEFIYSKRPTRYRFSLAHESGHAVLHQKVFRQLAFDSIGDWKRVQDEIDDGSYQRLELQANIFASHVLIPDDLLRGRFATTKMKVEEEARKVPGTSSEYRQTLTFRVLAKEFAVSEQAMRTRIKNADPPLF